MTEDEAKTKWCPMVRQGMAVRIKGVEGVPSINRTSSEPVTDDVNMNCIGSACMMWRDNLDRVLTGREILVKSAEGRCSIEKETVPSGYCGLAGKP